MLEAIRYGDQPECARLSRKIDNALDREHLMTILNRDALARESLSPERLFAVKGKMERPGAPAPALLSFLLYEGFESLGVRSIPANLSASRSPTFLPSCANAIASSPGAIGATSLPSCGATRRVCFTKGAVRPE